MRFLGIGDNCDLGALYHRLVEAGHEVKVAITEPLARGTLSGMVEQTSDWRAELPWIRAAGRDGMILFENVADARGALQDELRADGFQVIGGSAYGDRLENDRAYAQGILAEIGLPTAGMREFDDATAADAFLAANPGRYVLKFNGPGYAASDNYVGQLADGRDVRALLKAKLRQRGDASTSFVLMDHLDGVEMGVGAYFDGSAFLSPPCLDWEHKRFFTGDLGELTGEMGTVVTFDRSRRFFEMTLARMAPYLRQHGYCGYINLNTIVNERGIWPLEFCCRFTYPGFALLDALQETSWADVFRMMLSGGAAQCFAVREGFCVAIVLTTPPFPYTVKQVPEPVGLPVLFDGPLTPEDHANIHYGEVGLDGGDLVTSGLYGWTMVVTGVAPTIEGANAKACGLAGRAFVPNLRYRRDIGDRLLRGEYARLEALGLLDDAGPATRA
jgi:phosphoribosylamine--glycine ligase